MLKDQDGAVAIELAFLMPILIFILMAVVEFGLIFFTYEAEQRVTWDVSRQVAANRISPSDAPAKVRDGLPGWVGDRSVTVIGPTLANGQYTMTVSLPASAASPTSILARFYGGLVLSTTVVMQKEPSP
ncbi:TadE/TadG family type IV pilus assembly protein [Methylobacterium nodulans]|uniref:TadE family protein n=1 Tax=Methylobacterium nodulans (strain LMG 21967 / CNCM I-2342 / ORS 2060) TaxID=460265 RepID=B8IEJ3_METNO|nr:TadE family protein [Methylobacterium nodulans]ACL59565.1 TadE family protein [Methylobacterium nodulans ORS 2060]